MSSKFDDKKIFIQQIINFYRNRGYSLRGKVNNILKQSGIFGTKQSWEDTLDLISNMDFNEINDEIIQKVLVNFQSDLLSIVLYQNKFISIYDEILNFDTIYNALDSNSVKFDSDFQPILDKNLSFDYIKFTQGSLDFFVFKSIRLLATKIDLGLYVLKPDYIDDDFDKIVGYKTQEIPCFNSIIFDNDKKTIILSADLSSQFQEENLRAEIAKLVKIIRQKTNIGQAIKDLGLNIFPSIQKLYDEKEGIIKELAFKTNDGVAHREKARSGIDDVREGDYHIAGVASAEIEPYDIHKTYFDSQSNVATEVLVKGSWFILNSVNQVLHNATVTVNSEEEFVKIINKLIEFSK